MALVFLPGLLCDAALFAPQRAHLGPAHDITVADLTGFDDITEMARDVLDRAPPRFTLIGLSMGGYVALEIVRRAADRVERLALIDTSARRDDNETLRLRRGLIELARKGRFRGVTARLLPRLVHESRLADKALTGTVMAMAERVGREAYIRQQTAILNRLDQRDLLPTIGCPVAVAVGDADAVTPPALSREMAEAIPAASLDVIATCGHLASLERPERVNAILDRLLSS
ncbi:MAG: alpha/beta fold hydrolase [Azospirillaceae bacterium]